MNDRCSRGVWYDAGVPPSVLRGGLSWKGRLSMIARLSRVVPLLLVLAVVALVVYLVVAWRYSPNRGKEVLIRLFTIVTGALSAFFLIVCLYAWFDGNEAVLDLGASFLVAALVGLAVNRICRAVFLRHHPAYRIKPQKARRLGGLSRFWTRRR